MRQRCLSRYAMAMSAVCVLTCIGASGCGDHLAAGPATLSAANQQTDGGDRTTQPATEWSMTFDTAEQAGVARVELQPTKTAEKTFEVRLLLRDFKDLFGIAAHLRYDPDALQLTALDMQKVLDGAGYDARSIGSDSPKGRVLLGATRFRTNGSPYAALAGAPVGKQVWATLRFIVLTPGQHTLSFDADSVMAKNAKYEDVTVDFGSLKVSWQEVAR